MSDRLSVGELAEIERPFRLSEGALTELVDYAESGAVIDVEDIESVVGEVRELRAQVEAAKELHQPIDALHTDSNRRMQVCSGCGSDNGNWVRWPCQTRRALGAGEGNE